MAARCVPYMAFPLNQMKKLKMIGVGGQIEQTVYSQNV